MNCRATLRTVLRGCALRPLRAQHACVWDVRTSAISLVARTRIRTLRYTLRRHILRCNNLGVLVRELVPPAAAPYTLPNLLGFHARGFARRRALPFSTNRGARTPRDCRCHLLRACYKHAQTDGLL